MRRTVHTALAAGTLLLTIALPARAQGYRWDFGINGGFSWYSNSLDEDDFFIDGIDGIDEIDGDDLGFDIDGGFDSGWLVGAQLTYWVPRIFGWTDRLGIRANFAYTERPFEIDVDFDDEFVDDVVDGIDFTDEVEVEDINLWSGTGDLLFRFLGPEPTAFLGMEWLPYLALGLGAKWVGPAQDIEIGDTEGAIVGIGNRLFVVEKTTKLMGLVGLGTDIRLARRFALRAEVGDRIWDSPLVAIGVDAIDGEFFLLDEDEDVGDVINEIYGQLGLHILFGLEPEEVAVVAPPAPPPPPAEEAVSVCVIDPSLPRGIAVIQATYVPSTGDTLVTVNGQRVELRRALDRRVVVADETEWFSAGEPLTVTVDGETAEFVTYGGGRVIEPEDLAFLGTVDGTPIYAAADEVQDIREEIEERREARRDADLEEILEAREDLREEFDDVEILYVPLQPVGCVFQPVRRVEEVRKVRD
ncbi:MAG TPA: hypothetical protein VF158_17640 [Longimicrobiales bacterium]